MTKLNILGIKTLTALTCAVALAACGGGTKSPTDGGTDAGSDGGSDGGSFTVNGAVVGTAEWAPTITLAFTVIGGAANTLFEMQWSGSVGGTRILWDTSMSLESLPDAGTYAASDGRPFKSSLKTLSADGTIEADSGSWVQIFDGAATDTQGTASLTIDDLGPLHGGPVVGNYLSPHGTFTATLLSADAGSSVTVNANF